MPQPKGSKEAKGQEVVYVKDAKMAIRINSTIRDAAIAQARMLGVPIEDVVQDLLRKWIKPEVIAAMKALRQTRGEESTEA